MTWRVHTSDSVDSTNECAFRAIEAGTASDGDVFVAREQTAGRGTRGRAWSSARGGVYCSAVLESATVPAPGLWTVAGSLAVHDVATAHGARVALDWPNDVVDPSGAKLAGVLAESRGLGASGPARFVLGIGLNVESAPVAVDDREVTCLTDAGATLTVDVAETALLDALWTRIEEARARPSATFDAYFDRCLQAGHEVEVQVAGRTLRGRFDGIDPTRGVRLTAPGSGASWMSLAHVRSIVRV